MKVIASAGREDVAVVYIGELEGGHLVEFVEALQPPAPREQKWVLLVSTMFGCPIGCMMCDAGGFYQGKPSVEEIFAQVDYLVRKRYPDGRVPARQFKIQFARMGEPALNPHLLTVLEELPRRYHAPGLMPSISTVAPAGAGRFFERLLEIKQAQYAGGHFQFQFSLHTTDPARRDQIIPVKKWSFRQMAEYGERFYSPGDRKITLNFALAQGMPVEAQVLRQYFSPEKFLVKITPLNPTYRAEQNRLASYIDPGAAREEYEIVESLRAAGYQVIVSIGEVEENYIGSNCGQYIRTHLNANQPIRDGYTYEVLQQPVDEVV
ncbi:MAG: radical SAM protein [Chloroflexota bacterium]